MSDELHKDKVREIVRETVKETLVSIGVDLDDPMSFQADARFVRKLRETHERIGLKVIATMIGIVVTGGVSLIVVGAVEYLKRGGR